MGQERRRSVSQLQTFGLQSLLVLELLRSSSSESVRLLLMCVCVCVLVLSASWLVQWCEEAYQRAAAPTWETDVSIMCARVSDSGGSELPQPRYETHVSVSYGTSARRNTLQALTSSANLIILKESSHNSYILSILILRMFDAMCDPSPRTESGTAAIMSLCQHSINKRGYHWSGEVVYDLWKPGGMLLKTCDRFQRQYARRV